MKKLLVGTILGLSIATSNLFASSTISQTSYSIDATKSLNYQDFSYARSLYQKKKTVFKEIANKLNKEYPNYKVLLSNLKEVFSKKKYPYKYNNITTYTGTEVSVDKNYIKSFVLLKLNDKTTKLLDKKREIVKKRKKEFIQLFSKTQAKSVVSKACLSPLLSYLIQHNTKLYYYYKLDTKKINLSLPGFTVKVDKEICKKYIWN